MTARPRPHFGRRAPRPCYFGVCQTPVPSTRVFCEFHARMLQPDTRKQLDRTFRPGAPKQSALFLTTYDLCCHQIAYFLLEGHRAPASTSFDW